MTRARTSAILRASAFAACAVLAACGGAGYVPSTAPPASTTVIFPFDLTGTCAVETAERAPASPQTRWSRVPDADDRQLVLVEEGHLTSGGQAGAPPTVARVRDAAGKESWLRLSGPRAGQDPLQCAVDPAPLAARATPIRATSVRLMPTAPSCHGLALLTGGVRDVTFEPYAVLARRVYRTTAEYVVGVTLETTDGLELLTVSDADFAACFAATTAAALPADQSKVLLDWLVRGEHEGEPAPDAALTSALLMLGTEEHSCLREGQGATLHQECRDSAVAVVPLGDEAAAARVAFVRERLLNAVHGYGEKLVAPEEVIGANILVTDPKAAQSPFGNAFLAALAAAAADPTRQRRRAALGYRLIRPADVGGAVVPTDSVTLDVSLSPSPSQVGEEMHAFSHVARQTLPNPERARAAAGLAQAQAAAQRANAEVAELSLPLSAPAPPCQGSASLACNVVAGPVDVLRLHPTAVAGAYQAAATAFAGLPETVEESGPVTVPALAKVYRQRGEAKVKVTIEPHEKGSGPRVQKTLVVPFAAESFEVAADPARGIEAIKGAPPTADDVNGAAARAVVERVDEMVGAWMSRSLAEVSPDALEPGTRAHMVLLARHVASNHPVKLFSDVLEARQDVLASGQATYPIQLPPGSEGKCYTFVAAPADPGRADVNLTLSTATLNVGRDLRADPDAGFEICGAASGAYRATLQWLRGTPNAVFFSMFDSTPDAITEDDARAAAEGTPPTLGAVPRPAKRAGASGVP